MHSVIWWIRRDLRLGDNPVIQAALALGQPVVPVFIFDPALEKHRESRRFKFLIQGLADMGAKLQQLGSQLILRQGRPLDVLKQLSQEIQAERIFAQADYSPYASHRDIEVSANLLVEWIESQNLFPPDILLSPTGKPYSVFTPFSRMWRKLPEPFSIPLPAPKWMPLTIKLNTLSLHPADPLANFPAGEQEAQRRLNQFVETGIYTYASQRDRMDREGTSMLSPYLRFGMISIRQVVQLVKKLLEQAPDIEARRNADVFLNELIWREFYNTILFHFPQVLSTAFQADKRQIAWRDAPEDLLAWKMGLTGVPVVDAAMRQLKETGWMHNRARMITASFLVKDLLIDWREGEKWFMSMLVDGDPAANNGGWQWVAGVGTDAAPYFRILNPVLQGLKHDPEGEYVRRWVPELAAVPQGLIHQPWLLDDAQQKEYHCQMGVDYPAPIVDHREARARVLEAFQTARLKYKMG